MKSLPKKLPVLALALAMSATSAQSQQFYFNANCVSQIELEEQCNVSFMRRSMSARFDTGRATKIKYSNIRAWNYTDSTKLKMDTELAARIGIIGLPFKSCSSPFSASTTEMTLRQAEYDRKLQRFTLRQPDACSPEDAGCDNRNQIKKAIRPLKIFTFSRLYQR